MAGSIPDMLINVRLETSALKADMAQVTNKFKSLGTTVQAQTNPLKSFGKNLMVAAGVGLSIAGIANFTQQVIMAGEESQKSDKRLDQIAKSMGLFGAQTEVVTGRLKELADSEARLTGIDDDVIKQSQAKLLTFEQLALSAGEAGGAFDRATKASMDMAAAGFGEATQNAVQLGKALQDPIKGVTALSRSGITFTDQEKKKIKVLVESNKMMDAQAFVLKAIERQVGGTAEATATSTGKMKQAYGQVQEAIGIALLPLVEKFTAWVVATGPKVETFFKQLSDPTTEVGAKWAALTQGIADAFEWVMKNAAALASWAVAVVSVVVGFKALTFALRAYVFVVETARIAQALFAIALGAVNPAALVIGLAALAGAVYMIGTAASNTKGKVDALNRSLESTDDSGVGNGGSFTPTDPTGAPLTLTGSKAIPGSPESYYGNPKPGTVATWRDAKGKWLTATWTGDKWTAVKPVTYTSPSDITPEVTGTKKADAALLTYIKTTQKKLLDARSEYDKSVKAANEKYGALIQQYSQEMTDIVAESMNRLKSAWASAVSVDIGQMFSDLAQDGSVSADRLLVNLKSRLESVKNLASNAASLAGLGFSQTFIEQVVAQGPDVGNAMASALKSANPKTQKELQDLFSESEYVSNNGMNTLATNLYSKAGLATDALKVQFDVAKKNMEQAQKDLSDALKTAADALDASLKKISDGFNAYLKTTKADMKSHLNDINAIKKEIAAGEAIVKTPVTTPEAAIKGRLDMTAEDYDAFVQKNMADYVAGGGTLQTPDTAGNIKFGRGGVTNNVNVSVDTSASPTLIADTIVAALKFGTPISMMVA